MNKKIYIKIAAFTVIGALLGYSYYHFIGCNGSCTIAGNPYISTAYGALIGLVISFPSRKKPANEQ